MRKNIVLAVVLLFGLSGCFSAGPEKKYYEIHLEAVSDLGPFSASLLIDRIEIDSLYDDFRVIYRVSPYEINYYAYHFWADKPSKLLRNSLVQFLEASRLFPRIIQEPILGNADWIFRWTVHRIEEVDEAEAWFARLSMKLEVADIKTGAVLASRTFDRKEPMSGKDVSELPAKLSRILIEELRALFGELKGK
jgi:cholesterol transport system auxiliary component